MFFLYFRLVIVAEAASRDRSFQGQSTGDDRMSVPNVPLHKQILLEDVSSPLAVPADLQFVFGAFAATAMKLTPGSQRTKVVKRISDALGLIWYKMNLSDVRRVRHHLQLIFGNRHSPPEIESFVPRQLGLTVWNYLTLNMIPSLSRKQWLDLLPVKGIDHFASSPKGRPTLLLCAHAGPYAYPITAVLMAHGYQVRVVGHARPRIGSSQLYRKLYWPRISKTIEVMQVISTLEGPNKELLNILRAGDNLCLLLDHMYIIDNSAPSSGHIVQVPFFGGMVNLETGGLRLAKRFNAQILLALPEHTKNHHQVMIEPFNLPTTGLSTIDLSDDLRAYMERVEECIDKQPFMWRDLRRTDLLERLGWNNGA